MSSSLFNNSINYNMDHNELLNVLQSLSSGDGDFLMNLTGDEVFQNGNIALIDGSDLSNSIDIILWNKFNSLAKSVKVLANSVKN